MKAPNLHLNLLHASERQSSSPVRLRVMLPVLAVLACVGCLVWWGVLTGQLMLVKAQVESIKQDIAAKQSEHGGILGQMNAARNVQAEVDQLTMYANARRTYGGFFANLASNVPPGVALMELEIPEPPAQSLLPPGAKPGQKVKPLLGPTNTVDVVKLRILGRTLKNEPVETLMKSLEDPSFTNTLVIAKDVPPDRASPRIRSFKQDTSPAAQGAQLLIFDVEYLCTERRFEK